jgi:hypothetical protein
VKEELTYFKRGWGSVGADRRIMYELKPEYMRPIKRKIKRYWRAYIANGRFGVNTSSDIPTLPIEAWLELAEIYNDWIEFKVEFPTLPPPVPSEHPPSPTQG